MMPNTPARGLASWPLAAAAMRSPRPKIADPHPINSVSNRHFGIAVAEIAVELPRLILPADTIPQAPLRHDASGWCSYLPGTPLTGPTGFAPWKTPCAAHGSSLSS